MSFPPPSVPDSVGGGTLGTSLSSSQPAATAAKPPGASQRSAPSGSCPHPKQRLYLSSISGRLRTSGSGHPAACPDARVTVTPANGGDGGGKAGAGGATEGWVGDGGWDARAGLRPPVPPWSLTLPSATAARLSRGGPGRAPPPIHVIASPAAGQIPAAKHTPPGLGGGGAVGSQRRAPMGAGSLPLPMPAGQAGQCPAPCPIWGTHRRGVSSSALALHVCKGDPVPALAPAQNRRQRYPPDMRHPKRGPEGLEAGSRHSPSNPSGRHIQAFGQGDALGHAEPPKLPSPPSPGTLSHGLEDPRVSPSSALSRAPIALALEVAPHRLQGFGKGRRCLWEMRSRRLRVPA